MREAGVVESRGQGTWMHYRFNPFFPAWPKEIIKHVLEQIVGLKPYKNDIQQLKKMNNHPEKDCA